jgi:hypothetical protein
MGSTASALEDGARRAMGQRSRCAVHLVSNGRGVLVLVPTLESRPPRDRGGGWGKERRAQCFPQARGRPDSRWRRERRGLGQGAAGTAFSWGRVTKVARAFSHALLFGHPGASISHWQSRVLA